LIKKSKKYELSEIIKELKSQRSQKNIDGMARFGINPKNTLGVSITFFVLLLRELEKTTNLLKNFGIQKSMKPEFWHPTSMNQKK
jgi:3-methyladenine DNA glycosylase AlkD